MAVILRSMPRNFLIAERVYIFTFNLHSKFRFNNLKVYIIGIESSCDDTSIAVLEDHRVLSNVTANQKIHAQYGGVVPELASRAHLQHIIPALHEALGMAGVELREADAIAFTQGPGLLGSLLVGTSFAKSLAWSLDIPLISVNHMEAHILAHFIDQPSKTPPAFPFLALTVSGGHTQLIRVNGYREFEILGETLDDAAGEAFDKSAKLLGLPYPGGPLVDQWARKGNPRAFPFPKPRVDGLQFSFSGLKTSILYFVKEKMESDPGFIEMNLADICASVQHTIVGILMDKVRLAVEQTGLKTVAVGGGVAANSGLRSALQRAGEEEGWEIHIPEFSYCTDNGAMIGIAGYFKYRQGAYTELGEVARARFPIGS